MHTIIMNSENSKTFDPQRLLPNLSHKINLNKSDIFVALWNLSIYYPWKKIKRHTKIINLKYKLQHGMKNLTYLMDHIPYQMFKIILNIS